MNAQQQPPRFGRGIGAAFGLSIGGAAVLAALTPWLGAGFALRFVVAVLGFAYVLYAIAASGERVGRFAALVCWLVAACGLWLVGLPLAGYVLAHVGLVWLVRSLYYYSGLLPALADLGVSLLGAAFGAWAAQRSGSAWLALWCFFLVQALHVLIPRSLTQSPAMGAGDDAFARAQRAAEAAVRRLSSAN